MERVAVESELLKKFPVHVVPNAIDTARFRPLDRSFSRDALGLPRDLPLVLFGAINSTGDKRKGFAELVSAFRYLENNRSEIGVLIFGSDRPEVDIGVPTFCLGTLSDDYSLALAYSAADVFACPSREDNLPNTVVEALSCGLPIVAFETGGLVDLVDHGANGYLAAPFDPEDFAVGLEWCVNSRRRHTLSEQARNGAVRRYEQQVVSRVHLDLYRSLLAEPVDMKDASP